MNKIITIATLSLITGALYAQDIDFMDGSFTHQRKADHYYHKMAYNEALQYYQKALERSPDNESLMLKLADCYTKLNDSKGSLPYYETSISSREATSEDVLNYAEALAANGEFEKAEKWYDEYHIRKPEDSRPLVKKGSIKKRGIFYQDSVAYDVKPAKFNSGKDDFSPAYWNSTILFVSNGEPGGLFRFTDGANKKGFTDIYQWNNGQVSLFDALNKSLNEGPLAFYEGGKKAIITTNQKESSGNRDQSITSRLKLVIYAQSGGNWKYEADFPFNNPEYSVGHPSFDSRNQVLYFVSDKPGGKGGTDLYMSAYREGQWSEPEGVSTMNTEGDELFPFVSTTGDLYFASNGYGGLGGLDLYKTAINSPGGLIYNMGYPVNTSYDDFALALDETGKKGYISSNRKNGMGGDDIYELTIYTLRVESKLVDKETGRPVAGKIRIMDERTGQEVPYELAGDKIVFDALRGRLYKIIVDDERYVSQEMDVDTKTDERFISMEIPVTSNKVEAVLVKERTEVSEESVVVQCSNLSKIVAFRVTPGAVWPEKVNAEDPVNGGDFIEIKDIYFAFNSDEILSGEENLKKLADVLNRFQSVGLEITVYSDAYGTVAYNDDLSDRRGKKVIDHLTVQGVDKSRISLRVVGSRELFNTCPHPEECSKEEHRKNRRIEFSLVVIK